MNGRARKIASRIVLKIFPRTPPIGSATRSVNNTGHTNINALVITLPAQVGEAEYDVDRVKDDVEDFPENAAEWVGDKVGGVERFGDEVDYAYDEGRAEGRDGW